MPGSHDQNSSRPRPASSTRRGGGPRALAESLDRVTLPVFAARGFAGGAVVRDWRAIAGDFMSRHTLPDRIVFPARQQINGTLHLRVDSGSLALELQHLEPVLIERVNGYFGYKALARLKIVQAPLPKTESADEMVRPEPRPIDEDSLARRLADVKDGELKSRLLAIGRSVLARTENKDANTKEG